MNTKTEERTEAKAENLSVEESFARLDGMIGKLSNKETPLDEAFETYREGMELVRTLREQIDLVEAKVKVLKDEGGTDDF